MSHENTAGLGTAGFVRNRSSLQLREELKALEKSELHLHFRGCLSAELFCQMLITQRGKGYFPSSDPLHHFDPRMRSYLLGSSHLKSFLSALAEEKPSPAELHQLCLGLWQYQNPDDFFRTYVLTGGLTREAEGFFPLADHLSDYLHEHNVTYCELIFSIGEYLDQGWSYEQIASLMKYIGDKARKDGGCELYIILDMVRNIPAELSIKRLPEIISRDLPYVIGVTLGGDEKNFPARDFVKLFEAVSEAGWRKTCHAGEFDGPQSIVDAVTLLGAERIGHGIAAAQDPQVCDLLLRRGVTLEVCPTSNIFTRSWTRPLSEHPLRVLYDRGLSITIASDDPGFFVTTITDELVVCREQLGFSHQQILSLLQFGDDARFVRGSE